MMSVVTSMRRTTRNMHEGRGGAMIHNGGTIPETPKEREYKKWDGLVHLAFTGV